MVLMPSFLADFAKFLSIVAKVALSEAATAR
jgi:hypothetical protein